MFHWQGFQLGVAFCFPLALWSLVVLHLLQTSAADLFPETCRTLRTGKGGEREGGGDRHLNQLVRRKYVGLGEYRGFVFTQPV